MCRFIVYQGPDLNMASLVIDPEHSLMQLARKAHCHVTPVNRDGFGISWYKPETPIPNVYKDTVPAYQSSDLPRKAKEITSSCFFAHVRAASQGGITLPNCHPWTYKNISFMHNGTVPYFSQIKSDLLARVSTRAARLIQGSTDSETIFALFITNFERELGFSPDFDSEDFHSNGYDYVKNKEHQTESMVSALKTTLRQVHFLILQYENNNYIQSVPAEALCELDVDGASQSEPLPASVGIGRLNLAVSDGQTTCTSRYVTSMPKTAHTLYYSTGSHFDTQNYNVVLSTQTTPSTVIVSSEPLSKTYNCKEVPVNHMVVSGPNAHFSIESCM